MTAVICPRCKGSGTIHVDGGAGDYYGTQDVDCQTCEGMGAPKDELEALRYATDLAVSMHRKHYAAESPNWKPLGDLDGVLSQIDNMLTGLTRAAEMQVRAHPDEPLLHTDITDVLPDGHPLARESVHCDTCDAMVHCFNNECMQPWVEKYRSDLYRNAGNFCLECYAKAGGHPWPKGAFRLPRPE